MKNLKQLSVFVLIVLTVLIFLCYKIPPCFYRFLYYGTSPVISDVTKLTFTHVKSIEKPVTINEIQNLVQQTDAPIAIAGGRFSQGGQISYPDGIVLDMCALHQVISLDQKAMTVTVQAGITWYELLKFLDSYNLSVKVMQSYSDFTVGGSMSVNAHGRHIHNDPLINGVQSFKIVIADGSLVVASRTQNPDLFYAAIGGYGGLGVIVEATLLLTENIKLQRRVKAISRSEYSDYFFKTIHKYPSFSMHSAYIYPPLYESVLAVSYEKTEEALTISERLQNQTGPFVFDKIGVWGLARIPGMKELRPLLAEKKFNKPYVEWRNYELTYPVKSLDFLIKYPTTYILQEYFIPISNMELFMQFCAEITQKHSINVLNAALRFVPGHTESVLTYAPQDSFACVLYINMLNTQKGKMQAEVWTRELIDAALSCNGAYYLPYQLYAAQEQFKKAYPRWFEYKTIKNKYDPTTKFLNNFLKKYLYS